jgi:hypothetical protein
MTGLDPLLVDRLLNEAAAEALPVNRGKKYEDLLRYVFESVPGTLVVADQRSYFGSEQVDLAVSNGGAFPGLPEEFLVECKNYSDAVDSKAVGYFLFISISRAARLAVVVAANGLTGDPDETTHAYSLAAAASAMNCKLIVLTTADLRALTNADDLVVLMRTRWLNAWANGGLGASS